MQNLVNTYLEKFKRERRNRRRLSLLLLALALVVVTGVYGQLRLTGAAMTNETFCGLEEHQHDESCYEQVLICGLGESEGTSGHTHTEDCYETVTTLVCGLEESEGHTHADSCYTSVLTCGLEESEGHTHSEDCYDEEGNLICTLEESEGHTHDDSCYTLELTCTLEESEGHTHTEDCYETEQVLVCTLEEAEAETGHTHTEDCYETQLVCGLEEHTHTVECLSDESADLETADDWEATLPSLTGVWAEDVAAVAKSQTGYTESTANFILDEDGETRRGYTRYGAWAGNAYGDWDAMFVSFCLHYAGISQNDFPEATGAYAWSVTLQNQGMYEDASDYTPVAGDLIFFDTDSDGKIDRTGIVINADENNSRLTVIEGDYTGTGGTDAVCETTYSFSDSVICGYGVLPSQETEEENTEDAVEDTTCTLTFEGEDFAVTVTYGVDAELPENVELLVSEYEKDSETYQERYAEAAELYSWEEDRTSEVRLFHIGLYADGEEIEPAAEVEVVIAYTGEDGLMNYSVTHFGEETEDVEADSDYADGTQTITFGVNAFSDFLIAGTVETIDEDVAEPGDPETIQALAASGYFSYWSSQVSDSEDQIALASEEGDAGLSVASAANTIDASDQQITQEGGSSSSDDGVTVSKSIDGTDTENVFDITLSVTTTTEISELYQDPDMAVVIVMDISNTMTKEYGSTTRYEAAMAAAEDFIDQFAANTGGVSQVGFVAFNTDAHQIFGLSDCSSDSQATSLKNTMRSATGSIISASDYYASHSRFTNIEAGLKMASDMLASASNENKYIIFLSDGFPTTYISSGYSGYDPYTSSGTPGSDGVFYDYVTEKYCVSGTSYSDKAAIRARQMASSIKSSGVEIFSIGIDIGGQTITGFDTHRSDSFSVIDRTAESYEIGSASDASAFKNWLKNSIGSGHYYDSTDEAGLTSAFETIFAEIQTMNEASAQAKWVASDPLPTFSGSTDTTVEFLGFYNSSGTLQVYPTAASLTGSNVEGGENTASYSSSSISWDLKKSGYTSSTSGGTTTYTYTLTYRVRLQNESDDFAEGTSYATNGDATLTYQVLTTEGGETKVSDEKTLTFPVPEVEGYLGDLTFTKVDQKGNALAGVTFTLSHDTSTCSTCRGDGSSSVSIGDSTAISASDGTVSFTDIPSGHTYILTETVPEGYSAGGSTYTVTVAYGVVTVTETSSDGTTKTWSAADDYTIVNHSDPTVEKKVRDSDGSWVDENTAGISDNVSYKTTISNLTNASNLVLHDVLSDGLTDPYVTGVAVVTTDTSGNETEEIITAGYTVTYYTGVNKTADAADTCSFEVSFTDDFLSTLTSNQVLVIYYRATVTADAVIGDPGNPNTTRITYGTDSSSEWDTVKTYVYEINVYKYSGDKSLSGATFVLYREQTVTGAEGGGTNTVKQYAQVDTDSGTLTGWTASENAATSLTTDSHGMIYIRGLAPDTYYLVEKDPPEGYALLDAPVIITLAENGTISYYVEGAASATEGSSLIVEGNTVSNIVKVENTPSYELPTTGGPGTWMYTLVGLLLCGSAALVWGSRRKKVI